MALNPKKKSTSGCKAPGAKAKRKRVEADDCIDAEVIEEAASETETGDETYAREAKRPAPGVTQGDSKGFFEQLGEGFKAAGQTATRITKFGVARAELEKFRYDLKFAQAKLGEVVVRCWDDAPNLGLTAKDPAIAEAYKRVKELRLKIREKEATLAALKKDI